MADLGSKLEYEEKFSANHVVTGSLDGTTIHFPCPVCAEADWYVVKLMEFARSSEPLYCSGCGRTCQLIYEVDGGGPFAGGGSSMRIVQVDGPDAPAWMDYGPPRVKKAA